MNTTWRGFTVGVVDKEKILDVTTQKPGMC